MADELPTHRPDIAVLFGKELPRHGITCDLVAQCAAGQSPNDVSWPHGQALVCPRTGNRLKDQLTAFWHDCRILWHATADDYDAIQVRDKVFAGIMGLARAHRLKLPFFFWMSYPMSEAFVELARRERLSLGLVRWVFVAVKGHLGRYLFYRFLLPRCDHIFVQSDQMAHNVAHQGIARDRMTAVPMGVDLDRLQNAHVSSATMPGMLPGRKVIAYQGSLDRARRIDFLFEAFAEVRKRIPECCLLLVGDAYEAADREWLEARARDLGVIDAIVWTGWVPTERAWQYLGHADVAVSFIPRGELFDCSSPTKIVEYLALGLPVVANDLPDQHQVLTESGAGLSVASDVHEFADAIVKILNDPACADGMRAAGPPFVRDRRSYNLIGRRVAEAYRLLWRRPPANRLPLGNLER